MLLLRRVLLILLSLALPLNGWASISLASPCPMQMASMSAPAAMADMKNSCCNEHAKDLNKTSNPCKSGQECQTGTLYFASVPVQTASLPQSSSPAIFPVTRLAARMPTVVWRPPLTL